MDCRPPVHNFDYGWTLEAMKPKRGNPPATTVQVITGFARPKWGTTRKLTFFDECQFFLLSIIQRKCKISVYSWEIWEIYLKQVGLSDIMTPVLLIDTAATMEGFDP